MGKNENKNSTTRISSDRAAGPGFLLKACKLSVVQGPERGKELLIHKPVIRIGTKEDNDLKITDNTVSRHHLEIHHLKEGYLLRDLDSTNGTFVGGVRVKEAYLKPGVNIRIGDTIVEFLLKEERIGLTPSEKFSLGSLEGTSLEMRRVFAVIEKVAVTEATVIIEGETGTGKELAARAIHSLSPRAQGPFIVFDCGAVVPTLIESELFGHEKGAFTGATAQRKGSFELAHGGSIFLDEVGELNIDLQPKLLRTIEQRVVRRVGGQAEIPVDVRVIAATNKDLQDMVKEEKFREDLFFRLSVVKVELPPLRRRPEDIPILAKSMVKKIRGGKGIAPEAMDVLRSYSWPGNARELRNVIERAAALADGPLIKPGDLASLTSSKGRVTTGGLSALIGKSLEEIERIAIIQTLKAQNGNKAKTAKILKISPSTLYEKIRRYGIE